MASSLKGFAKKLEARAKQLADDDVSNDNLLEMVMAIRGSDHESGLVGVFTEQMSLGDQAQITFDDVKRQLEATSSAVANALVDFPDFPPGPAPYIDELKRFIRTWSDEQRGVALRYAIAAAELREGETMTEPMPERVRQACARAHEWSMSEDEREHWLARGPFEPMWENDAAAAGVVLWYAQRESGDQKIPDPSGDRFATEKEAAKCCARLNRAWFLTMQGEPGEPDPTPTGAEQAEANDDPPPEGLPDEIKEAWPVMEAIVDRARSLAAAEGDCASASASRASARAVASGKAEGGVIEFGGPTDDFADMLKEEYLTRARQELIDEAAAEATGDLRIGGETAVGDPNDAPPAEREAGEQEQQQESEAPEPTKKSGRKRLTHTKKKKA